MALLLINRATCPECDFPIEIQLFAISSRLGPAQIICRRCKNIVSVNRREWAETKFLGRLRFLIVSLFYIALGGLIGGNMFFAAQQHWQGQIVIKNLPWDSQEFQALIFISGLMVVGALISKITGSLRRTSVADIQPSTENGYSLNFTFFGQVKMLLIFFIPFLIAYLKLRIFSL